MFNYLMMGNTGGGTQLATVLIENSALGCDYSQGEAKASWTLIGSAVGVTIDIEYNFDGGSTYYMLDPGIPASAGFQYENVSAEPGFVDLDSTYFKFTAWKNGLQILGSPQYANPPFACE